MTGRVFRVLLLLVLIALFAKACIVRDIPSEITNNSIADSTELSSTYPMPKNVNINGIDYLQSQAPAGIFDNRRRPKNI